MYTRSNEDISDCAGVEFLAYLNRLGTEDLISCKRGKSYQLPSCSPREKCWSLKVEEYVKTREDSKNKKVKKGSKDIDLKRSCTENNESCCRSNHPEKEHQRQQKRN